MASKSSAKKTVRNEDIPAGDLAVDPKVQRETINATRIRKMTAEWSHAALGTLVVSERPDGSKIILDGQHRWTVARDVEGDDFPLPCRVLTGLRVADEATLFLQLNSQTTATPVDKFKVRITLGEEAPTAINTIVRRHDWTIGRGGGKINAVTSLEKLYNSGQEAFDNYGPTLVSRTLGIVTAAWGYDDQAAVDKDLLKAIGMFLLDHERWLVAEDRDPNFFDDSWLAENLERNLGGPSQFLAACRLVTKGTAGSLHQTIKEELTKIYNKGRRTQRLPTIYR